MTLNHTHIQPLAPAPVFLRLGERLCLDFVNTLAHRLTNAPDDLMPNYHSLVEWAAAMELISTPEVEELIQVARETPHRADAVFARALTLRETLYRLFRAVVIHVPPDEAALADVHTLYLEALAHTRLTLSGTHYALTPDSALGPESILWAVARSAVELLTLDDLSRLKQCPGLDDCGFLFLDTSKNGTRTWCSMNFCGSRAKMRRLYARKRQERES